MIDKHPNIIFIVIDSARYDHFSTYGYPKPTTPFIDSISQDLVIYENANAPAAWTRPAMSSIFTSLYPEQYGFSEGNYPQTTPLLTEILKANGYMVFMLSNNAYMSPLSGFDRGCDRFYFVRSGKLPRGLDMGIRLRFAPLLLRQRFDRYTSHKILPEMLNAQALRIIRSLGSSKQPFFIYIHHDAHHPYLSKRDILRKFLEGVSEEEIRQVEAVQRSGNMYWFNRESLSTRQRQRYYTILRAMHDASIYKNDCLIHDLFRELSQAGLYDSSMIIITADHGEFLGERDMISHGLYLYEESVRVPLLVKYPREMKLVGRSGKLVTTIDLAPTILDLVGRDIRGYIPEAQGRSLLETEQHKFVVCQRRNFTKGIDFWKKQYPDHNFEKYDYGNLICFKSDKTKFVWSSRARHALFDISIDPNEEKNIYDPDLHAEYLMLAEKWIREVPKVESALPGDFDEDIKRHLRGLGYIE